VPDNRSKKGKVPARIADGRSRSRKYRRRRLEPVNRSKSGTTPSGPETLKYTQMDLGNPPRVSEPAQPSR